MSVGPPQGVSWVFEGYGVLLRGFIKGFSDGLYCFSDSSDSCQFYTETVILLRHCFLLYCSFLTGFQTV